MLSISEIRTVARAGAHSSAQRNAALRRAFDRLLPGGYSTIAMSDAFFGFYFKKSRRFRKMSPWKSLTG